MSSAALVRALAAERDALRVTTAQQLERLQQAERKLRSLEAQRHNAAVDSARLSAEARKVGSWRSMPPETAAWWIPQVHYITRHTYKLATLPSHTCTTDRRSPVPLLPSHMHSLHQVHSS